MTVKTVSLFIIKETAFGYNSPDKTFFLSKLLTSKQMIDGAFLALFYLSS